MKIDLDRIPRDRPCAVHIPTVEHGRVFLDEMRARFPDAVRTWSEAHFMAYRLRSGGNYYYPRLHEKYPHMTHGDKLGYISMGVDLMSFEEILAPDIELDTVLGDVPIESLFG